MRPFSFTSLATMLVAVIFVCGVWGFALAGNGLYEVRIEYGNGVIPGDEISIPVTLYRAGPEGMGGFSLQVAYDRTAIALQDAYLGEPFGPSGCVWEYFTYRSVPVDNCTPACPSALVLVVGVADINNGTTYPVCRVPASLPAELFRLRFLISEDPALDCQTIPLRFFWLDCTDNVIASTDGTILYVSDSITDFPPSSPAINATEGVEFPTYLGAQEECVGDPDGPGPRTSPVRGIDFYNGVIDVYCREMWDCRGDLNRNGQRYEAADAVLFLRMSVCCLACVPPGIPPEAVLPCTDINADGVFFTVADLVHFIRILVGEAPVYPKASAAELVKIVRQGDILATDSELGAALVVFEGETTPTLLAEGMEIQSRFDGVNTRVLITPPFGEGVTHVATFKGPFLSAAGKIISVEVALPDGREVPRVIIDDLPGEFALGQNYPNPFNPGTIIAFSLPVAGDVNLEIYNMLGQEVVTLLNGTTEAGEHRVEWNGRDRSGNEVPSGIYLYRLVTGAGVETKKMILIR